MHRFRNGSTSLGKAFLLSHSVYASVVFAAGFFLNRDFVIEFPIVQVCMLAMITFAFFRSEEVLCLRNCFFIVAISLERYSRQHGPNHVEIFPNQPKNDSSFLRVVLFSTG